MPAIPVRADREPRHTLQMIIEVLYFDGCPNHERLLRRLHGVLAETGNSTPLTLRRITSAEHAERERFLGSPSLRVDGRDIEPGAAQRTDFGLKCRVYLTADGLSGLPPDDWILAALNAATGGG